MKITQLKIMKVLSLVVPAILVTNVFADDKYALVNVDKNKASFSVILESDKKLKLGVQGASITSKSYYQSVSGAELLQGVNIFANGKGAVVRLTPVAGSKSTLNNQAVSIDPNQLSISNSVGEVKASSESMALMADSSQLKQSYPELFENTAAFKLNDAMGTGTFILKSSQKLSTNSQYLINVLDKNSSHGLQVQSKSGSYQFSDKLKIRTKLTAFSRQVAMATTAELVAPDGRRWPLDVRQQNQYSIIESNLNMNTERKPGVLWKVVVNMSSKDPQFAIKRTAELALDIHSSTAKVKGFKVAKSSAALHIEVTRPGRYEARAWLFAKDANQQWVPAMLVYGANWFDLGAGQIQLPIDRAKLAAEGFSGKIKFGQVQLLDQSRLAVLSTRVGNWQVSGENNLTSR